MEIVQFVIINKANKAYVVESMECLVLPLFAQQLRISSTPLNRFLSLLYLCTTSTRYPFFVLLKFDCIFNLVVLANGEAVSGR